MSGILLYLDKQNGIYLQKFHEALNFHFHRGLKDEKLYYLELLASNKFKECFRYERNKSRPKLALDYKHLSIIDLTISSRQPILNNIGNLLISLNNN